MALHLSSQTYLRHLDFWTTTFLHHAFATGMPPSYPDILYDLKNKAKRIQLVLHSQNENRVEEQEYGYVSCKVLVIHIIFISRRYSSCVQPQR